MRQKKSGNIKLELVMKPLVAFFCVIIVIYINEYANIAGKKQVNIEHMYISGKSIIYWNNIYYLVKGNVILENIRNIT